MATKKLLKHWYSLGRKNIWIREAEDPKFSLDVFTEKEKIDDFIRTLLIGNWSLGQAFYYKDLCLINQINGGDEWLVIKGYGNAIDSWTVSAFKKEKLVNAIRILSDLDKPDGFSGFDEYYLFTKNM